MSIFSRDFGTLPSGEDAKLFILDNGNGLKAEITNYGGIIKRLIVKDKSGTDTDVVLGRDSLEEYLDNFGFYGAAIGRYANRIEDSEFVLNGFTYSVGSNEGKNSLHGGKKGFDKKLWTAKPVESSDGPSLKLSLESVDMEEGFPGNLKVDITYTLTVDNSFKIEYCAVSDKDTVVNLTNHSYFNLAGHSSGKMTNQLLQINSSFYTPNTKDCLPSGEVLSVDGTPFDFREMKPIGADIAAEDAQIQMFGGYDHNFAIDGRGYRIGAIALCRENGIKMTMYTDKPGVQLYTTNGVESGRVCKDNTVYGVHQAFCLETQYFPNSMKYSHFPSPVLKSGDIYNFTTEYKFRIEK